MSGKYIVCGSRELFDAVKVYGDLDFFHGDMMGGISEIVEGGASGADTLARYWAKHNKVKVTTVKADWKSHGGAAGPIRNERMLKEHPDIEGVIAFPEGGPGTAHMMKIARAAGYKVFDCMDQNEQYQLTLMSKQQHS